MSDDLAWKDIARQFGELIRIALGQVLYLLRTKPLVALVLACTFAISYETLYQLAHGEPYHSLSWIAVLFPLQLDLAAIPGLQQLFGRGRALWVRMLGGGEALFAISATAFGNLASHFDWAHSPTPWLATLTTVFISLLTPIMGGLCLIIAHLPTGEAPKVIGEAKVRPRPEPEKTTEKLHSVPEADLVLADASMPAAREYAQEFIRRFDEQPMPAPAIATLPPALQVKARADNNVGKVFRAEWAKHTLQKGTG